LAIVIALGGLKLGLEGQVYSQFLAQALFGCIAFGVLWQYSRPTLSRPVALRLLRYGIPLIPFFIFIWLNEASGRFLLERFGDLRLLGIFALAAQFGSLMLLFATSLDYALTPHFMERAGLPGGPRELGLLVTRYLTLFGLLGIAVIIGAPPVIRLIASPDFFEAIVYVAPMALASWLQVASQPLNWSLTFSGRTGVLSTIRGLTFGVLIGLLFLFLGPLDMGINGVILATGLAHLVSATVGFVLAQQGYRLQMPWGRLVPICAVLLAGGVAVTWLGSDVLDWAQFGLQLLVFAVLAVLTGRLAGISNPAQLWRPRYDSSRP
jgi:O-antigen/teichoic acid export membrane protein